MADVVAEPEAPAAPQSDQGAMQVPIDRIAPNPDQPRRYFAEDALAELVASVREKGVIQPLIVRANPRDPEGYEIVAGERRWRAAQRAQLHELPVIVRDFDDTEVLEVAIIENIQRADLNPGEEANGYKQLMERFGHTQEKLAEALGKSRPHIANTLRLLSLPDAVLTQLQSGKLSAGHARALVTSDAPVDLANRIGAQGLSVRDAERLAKGSAEKAAPKPRVVPEKDADTRALEQDLSAALKMRINIEHKSIDGDGVMTISYRSLDDLDRLCQLLTRAGSI